MKTGFLALAAVAILATNGCNTTQQRVAYNSIASVEQAASASVDGYYTLVIRGVLPTNDVPTVAQKFNQIQAACTVAAATAENGTNALAPAQLNAELTDLSNFISTLQNQPTK